MRFADLDGSMIDVYQATTQMTDESGQSYPLHIDTLLDNAIGPEGYYGVFTTNMHTDSASHAGRGRDRRLRAQSRDVPVVSARQMLEWLDGRNDSSFDERRVERQQPRASRSPRRGLERPAGDGADAARPSASSPASPATAHRSTTTTRTIKGTEYAFIDAAAGSYAATYAVDETAPAISNVAHSAAGDGTATITWDTNEASTSRVDYGTSAGALNQSETSPGLTTSHSIQLTGLAPNTTYYYRVTSRADAVAQLEHRAEPAGRPGELHDPLGHLHRHHGRRLQRRHPRREHLRLRDRQRRGHPEADGGPGVLGRAGTAGRVDGLLLA